MTKHCEESVEHHLQLLANHVARNQCACATSSNHHHHNNNKATFQQQHRHSHTEPIKLPGTFDDIVTSLPLPVSGSPPSYFTPEKIKKIIEELITTASGACDVIALLRFNARRLLTMQQSSRQKKRGAYGSKGQRRQFEDCCVYRVFAALERSTCHQKSRGQRGQCHGVSLNCAEQ